MVELPIGYACANGRPITLAAKYLMKSALLSQWFVCCTVRRLNRMIHAFRWRPFLFDTETNGVVCGPFAATMYTLYLMFVYMLFKPLVIFY